MIQDGRRFPGPIELIAHHKLTLDGFLTKPRVPCSRPDGVAPMAWPGVTMNELEQALLEKALGKGSQVCVSEDVLISRVLQARVQSFPEKFSGKKNDRYHTKFFGNFHFRNLVWYKFKKKKKLKKFFI